MKTASLTLSITLLIAATSAQAASPQLSTHVGAPAQSVAHPGPSSIEGAFLLTQSGSNTVTAGNSVSCNQGAPNYLHTENSYYRRFNLDGNFSATGTVTVTSVDFGVEQATGSGGAQPISVKLYAIPNASALTVANLGAAIATANLSLPDQTLTVVNAPIAGAVDALVNDLVVEILSPDGTTAGNTFFMGSNTTASVNPPGAASYLRAPGCGVNEPTATSSIGFSGMNIVMTVHASSLPVSLQEYTID